MTTDAEMLRRLNETLLKHREDPAAWGRLAEMMMIQRQLAGHGNLRRFCAEKGVNYKQAGDLERNRPGRRGGRRNFELGTVIDFCRAYGVTPESFGAVLDDPAAALAPARDEEPAAAAVPPAAVQMSGVLTGQETAAAAPYATRILVRLRDLAADGHMHPSGHEIFGPFPDAGPDDVRRWDKLAGELPDDQLAWLIAGLRVRAAATGKRDRTAG